MPAEPISAGTLAAISALSALAQAGGAGMAGYYGGEAAEKDRKFRERQWLQSVQDNETARATDNARYRDNQAAGYRAEVAQRPANSVGLLSGLSNLSQGMARSNPLDVLGFLAGG